MIVDEFYKKMDLTEPDFFKEPVKPSKSKWNCWGNIPDIFKFMEEAFLEDVADIKLELGEKENAN